MQSEPDVSIETILGPAALAGVPAGGPWRATLASARPEEGVEEIVLSLETEDGAPHAPPRAALALRAPIGAAVACWTPQHVHFEMPLPWTQARVGANAARDLPLYANVGPDGAARLVLAVSECVRRVAIRGVVDEFRSDEEIEVAFFTEPEDAFSRYSARIRLDTRVRPFAAALSEAARWLDGFAAVQLAALCPYRAKGGVQHSAFGIRHPAAKRPWYSTWYSYHQHVSAEAVVAEARAARRLGMRGLLLDAGWMKSRPGVPGGWMAEARFGDWIPDRAKIPDMRALSRAVRAEGLAFGLWFALPFVSRHATAWNKWKDRMLWIRRAGASEWGILDPRFPEVRAHLASLFGRVTREWELDGLKLDFIDSFELRASAPANAPGAEIAPNLPAAGAFERSDLRTPEPEVPSGGRDFVSVPRAVVALMADVSAAIRAANPDAFVEFRQGYVGPAIRPFGTMLRASDCPSCIATNRIKTIDLRLTSGATPVHGDMLEWDLGASAEDAALQLLATLFAVPQISVRLADLPPRHRAMLRFWLRFWNAHRATLLDAPFRPLHPEAAYPAVAAAGAKETITAVYQSGAVADALQDGAETGYVVNATAAPGLAVRIPARPSSIEILDCTGRRIGSPPAPRRSSFGIRRSSFVADLPVPPSGMAVVRPAVARAP